MEQCPLTLNDSKFKGVTSLLSLYFSDIATYTCVNLYLVPSDYFPNHNTLCVAYVLYVAMYVRMYVTLFSIVFRYIGILLLVVTICTYFVKFCTFNNSYPWFVAAMHVTFMVINSMAFIWVSFHTPIPLLQMHLCTYTMSSNNVSIKTVSTHSASEIYQCAPQPRHDCVLFNLLYITLKLLKNNMIKIPTCMFYLTYLFFCSIEILNSSHTVHKCLKCNKCSPWIVGVLE